jgi:hypothetical protein
VLPPPGTPDACLATGSFATTLQKRTLIFSKVIGPWTFSCHVDGNGNIFQDCLNAMYKICFDNTDIQYCKEKVDQMFRQMSSWWQDVRKQCGQWKWDETVGNVNSEACTNANILLQKNAYYVKYDLTGNRVNATVPSSLIDSINKGFWSNSNLKE